MSINVCSITGQPLSRPVVSRKTGHLYEKETIEKHLTAFPYCPVTNQPMQLSDLIDVASTETALVKPN
jgi:SUMO ligase MMS21 Smc5/6 complex component